MHIFAYACVWGTGRGVNLHNCLLLLLAFKCATVQFSQPSGLLPGEVGLWETSFYATFNTSAINYQAAPALIEYLFTYTPKHY